jgi:radical SAM family protein
MSRQSSLRVVLLKPSKYAADGSVERFRWGFMPNSTITFLKSLTPAAVDGTPVEVIAVDEYVHTDLAYLSLLAPEAGKRTLLALVGVQSHQFPRALDLAALARSRGIDNVVIGGPHPMTCDTSAFHGRGVSFALAEAEMIWLTILRDAMQGELRAVYGAGGRWGERLDPPPLVPPTRRDLRRYAVPMLGVYPARGCPYTCNFCSVIKIAGRQVRSQPVETTIASLKAAAAAGVRLVIFTSDNFNKYSEVFTLLDAMIEEKIRLPFFAQCDAQVHRQEDLIVKLAQAGCFQMFVGVESFSREALREAHKFQNHPEHYARIVELCRAHGITSHFSNILGFPTDTEAAIREHADTLRALAPDVASFYILTPIPGTEQYDDFLAAGLITEPNLDRFDGTAVVWRHPRLPPERLTDLLYRCYRGFYSARHIATRTADRVFRRPDFRTVAALFGIAGYGLQSRFAAAQRMHPMAGGTLRVRRDRADDYRPLRRRHFGCDLVPLPQSLALTAADHEINQRAKLVAIGAAR